MVGNANVGKTSMIWKYIYNIENELAFGKKPSPTIGTCQYKKKVTVKLKDDD
jgi:GTPase SAR1 family protein